MINVSGHRLGTAEVEGALAQHPACAEAAVVGIEHEVKGESIYAFVTLKDGHDTSEDLRKVSWKMTTLLRFFPLRQECRGLWQELRNKVREIIGPFASPDAIHWAPGLPKTRSGKIMRRVLRKIASHQVLL